LIHIEYYTTISGNFSVRLMITSVSSQKCHRVPFADLRMFFVRGELKIVLDKLPN